MKWSSKRLRGGSGDGSERLELVEGEEDHAEQQPAVPEARDLRLAVAPARVAHRDLDDLQVELGGTEDEVEVAEGIEIAEVGAVRDDPPVMALQERLGAAKRIGQALVQEPSEEPRKDAVGDKVQKAHRVLFLFVALVPLLLITSNVAAYGFAPRYEHASLQIMCMAVICGFIALREVLQRRRVGPIADGAKGA